MVSIKKKCITRQDTSPNTNTETRATEEGSGEHILCDLEQNEAYGFNLQLQSNSRQDCESGPHAENQQVTSNSIYEEIPR